MTERKRLTPKARKLIYDKYGGRCAYCGQDIPIKGFCIDHIHPLHRGGDNSYFNLNPACGSCNHYKSTFTIEEFRAEIGRIPDRLRRDSVTYRLAERMLIVGRLKPTVKFYFEDYESEVPEWPKKEDR